MVQPHAPNSQWHPAPSAGHWARCRGSGLPPSWARGSPTGFLPTPRLASQVTELFLDRGPQDRVHAHETQLPQASLGSGEHAVATQGSWVGSFSSVGQGPAVARPSALCTHVLFHKAGSAPQAGEHASEPSCLTGQAWRLQASTTAGSGASTLHRAGGSGLRRVPWASTQRTALARRPPPQETLHAPKSPAAQYGGQGLGAQDSDQAAGCWLPSHRAASAHSFLAWSRQP